MLCGVVVVLFIVGCLVVVFVVWFELMLLIGFVGADCWLICFVGVGLVWCCLLIDVC